MKKIIVTIVIGLIFYNCKAQSPILNMEVNTKYDAPNNSYYKDINNVKSLKYFNGKYYEDLLVGGYQYIKDGIEKINTLSDANDPSIGRNAGIRGNNIYKSCKYLPINDCVDGEKNLDLSINDIPKNGHIGDLRLFKRTINGQEALKANIIMNYLRDVNGELPNPTLPWKMANTVLIKQ